MTPNDVTGTILRRARRLSTVLLAAALLGGAAPTPLYAAPAATAIKPDQRVGERFLARLRKLSAQTLGETAPGPANAFQALKKAPAFGSDGKPGVLYVGGDFCPYCAALRWPLVLTLLRFGELHGLRYMRSSHEDVYADTPTFSFYGARFESDVVSFRGIEVSNRERKKLAPLDGKPLAIFKRYDAMPYTSSEGAIPFLYLDGKYALYGAPFSPEALDSLDWKQIADTIAYQPQAKLSQDIVGAANLLTAAICELTHGVPTRTCAASGVVTASKALSAGTGD